MFEKILNELSKLEAEGITIRAKIPPDEKGYIDKECPRKECMFNFKVNAEDWKNLFSDNEVFCPKCREQAPSNHWLTTYQVNEMQRRGIQEFENRIGAALQEDAHSFNLRQRNNSFFKMSMSVSGFQSCRSFNLPISAREVFEQEIKCEKCSARFAVVGNAYFCPCCGNDLVLKNFDDSNKKIAEIINSVETLKEAVQNSRGKDEAEAFGQTIIESSLSNAVASFQRLLDQLYLKYTGAPAKGNNVFQKLSEGSELWKRTIGKSYEDWLSPDELKEVAKYFQQRHLLAHCGGVVDDKYLNRSYDSSYKLGQRIIVKQSDVLRGIKLIKAIADGIRIEIDAKNTRSSV